MKHPRKIRIGILVTCVTACTLLWGARLTDRDLSPGYESIREAEVYNLVKTMALPRFAGRHTGHEGYTEAAKWAAALFEEWGLKTPSLGQGYMQAYPSPYVIVDEATMTLLDAGGKERVELEAETDFLPMLASDSGDSTAGCVFAGWGIHAPDLGYDDYAGLDVKGKFVLCFRGVPDRRDDRFTPHDHHRHRMQTARDRGALGVFYIYDSPLANPNMDLIEGFTPAIISERVADLIMAEKGILAADLRRDLQAYQRPIAFPLSAPRVHFRVQSRHFPRGIGYNVVGFVEGSDPNLRQECLVYGGHFDHCGRHMGLLFPGANDNASGSAVVMEVAEAFSRLKTTPKRSVVFVLFGGEEMGLQGSTYFAGHIPGPLERVDAMFNFDMVGEGDGVGCSLSPEPEGLKLALERADERVSILDRTRFLRGVGVRGSDFAPFHQKGIPCISFASNGPHLAYHLSGDTIYRINPDIMADTARLAFLTGAYWADR